MSAKDRFQRFLILVLVSVSFFYGGFYYGKRGYDIEIKKNPPKITVRNKNPGDRDVDFSQFWEVWDMVNAEYLERPVDPQELTYGAIKGMVASLGDPYTSFLPPEVNETVTNSINSSYQGIGAELGLEGNQLMVVAPLDGSPAKAAGVKSGDKILEIEGESTVGITVMEAVVKIRGDAGTVSTMLMQSENSEPREVKITRDLIKIDSVTWEDKGEGTAYIRISRFGQETNNEWDRVVREVNTQMEQLDAIVLDLRGNPGGYLLGSVYIASDFINNKTVVIQQEATGDQYKHKSPNRVGNLLDVPEVFILIDGGSASAAEILAAALHDHLGSKLIGVKSFGKGTIQDARDFEDGSGIHLTTGKWLTPNGEWLHGKGLEPDVVIELSDEDYENQNDKQLDKALEMAREL